MLVKGRIHAIAAPGRVRSVQSSPGRSGRRALAPCRAGSSSESSDSSSSSSSSGAIDPDGIIGPDGRIIKRVRPTLPTQHMTEEQKQLWKRAIKLPMYSVGLAPVLVSATAAFCHFGAFNPLKTLGLCVAAVAIIAWLNLSNDVFDSATGVDKNKSESVVNLVGGNWRSVFAAANVFLFVGVALLFGIVSAVPNEFVAKALYAAIACGYVYQGPPFRWSYLGLGEPLCFLAFGPLATNAFYLAQIPVAQVVPAVGASLWSVIPASMWAISTFVGLSTTVILFTSHFHQIEGDRATGKMSPLVRLGVDKATSTLKLIVGCTYTVMLVLSLFGVLPFAMWTSAMVSYGWAGEMVKFAEANRGDDLKSLKFLATRWHIIFTGMLALGLVVAKLMVI